MYAANQNIRNEMITIVIQVEQCSYRYYVISNYFVFVLFWETAMLLWLIAFVG